MSELCYMSELYIIIKCRNYVIMSEVCYFLTTLLDVRTILDIRTMLLCQNYVIMSELY